VKRKQQGIYIEAIALVIFLAAIGGLWAYYHVQLAATTRDNAAKDVAIQTMAVEKAQCLASVAGLQTANTQFNAQVQAQNKALAEIQQERNDKAAIAAAAVRAAANQSLTYKKRIANIMAQVAGTDWCKSWETLVNNYTAGRQAPTIKEPSK